MIKFLIFQDAQEYLLFPLSDKTLTDMQAIRIPLEQFQSFLDKYKDSATSYESIKRKSPVQGTLSTLDSLFIKQKEYYSKILFSRIAWLEASRSYCYIQLDDQTRMIVTHPMAELEKKLPADHFIRIHRSYIVNTNFVDAFIGNMLYIGKKNFPISKQYKNKVWASFNFLETLKE